MTSKPFGNLFINAGAMKAGTTWLYWALRLNPQLYFSLEKEIHYFHRKYIGNSILNDAHRLHQTRNQYSRELQDPKVDLTQMREFVRWMGVYLSDPMDDEWYAKVIKPPGNQQWSCDFSNLYSELSAEHWQDIAASCEKLRVLYLFRDPLHRLWSHLKFDLKFNGQLDTLPNWSLKQVETYLRQKHLWKNAEYGEAIRRLTTSLEPTQIKFMFLPEQHTDALGFLREVESFVDIAPKDYPKWILRDKVNQSDPAPMPPYFADLFRTDVERIKDEMRACGVNPPDYWL